jgi:branched-chain amino acid transport system ATP-binding protein
MAPLLDVRDLTSGYGTVDVLHGVSLAIHAGETVAILGSNGAGKSTLVNTLAGVLRPSGGRVTLSGEEVTGLLPEHLAGKGLSLVRQGRSVFPYMTVQENLEMGAYLTASRAERQDRTERVFQMFPVLRERRRQAAGSMSGGEQKMLEVGRSLMLPLKLLLLDEPSLGLAPIVVDRLFERIWDLNRTGLTILLVEQNAFAALDVSTRAYVLELGQIRLEGDSRRLVDNPEIRHYYLGAGLP